MNTLLRSYLDGTVDFPNKENLMMSITNPRPKVNFDCNSHFPRQKSFLCTKKYPKSVTQNIRVKVTKTETDIVSRQAQSIEKIKKRQIIS